MKINRLNMTLNPAKKGHSSKVAKSYYSQLSNDQIYAIYQHYEIDFALFGYTIDDYLNE